MSGNSSAPVGTVTVLVANDEVRGEDAAALDGVSVPLGNGRFAIAFARAANAVDFALQHQQQLTKRNVLVGLAIHTGDAELDDDGHYTRAFIARATGLLELTHPGQTLLSAATRALVLDALPAGADAQDLGTHRLGELERPERVYQLTHPAIPARFPPLRSHEPTHGSLPVQLTSLIGRADELQAIQDLLGANRLVTLTGAGGCGKTRLAVETARRLWDRFAGGVWFCDLGVLADPEVLPQTVCDAIGAHTAPDLSEIDAACAHLASSRALLVLDNCEHLIDACAELIQAMLGSCPRVTILTTSREPIGNTAEVTWRVPSLRTPDAGSPPAIEDVATFESVQLFVQRASQSRPDFALSSENAGAVAAVCSRLDGIPLALELAAARVRVLSVEQIAAGLSDRFRVLGRGARTLLPRQQTLQASVGWSHDLLSSDQRAVFRRVSVFAGTFSLEAAESVAANGDVTATGVLELLAQLVDRSMLATEDTTYGPRYRMLETIRHFARERLVDAGEATHTANRHLEWYTSWTAHMLDVSSARATVPDPVSTVAAEYDNIRNALEWAIAAGQANTGLRLASSMWPFWLSRSTLGSLREARRWLRQLLASAVDPVPAASVHALRALADAEGFLGDGPAAAAATGQAVEIARASGDGSLIAYAVERAAAFTMRFDPERAMEQLTEAEGLARATGADGALALALVLRTNIHVHRGEVAEAKAAASEGLSLSLGTAYPVQGASLHHGLAFLLLEEGDLAGGVNHIERAIELARAAGADSYLIELLIIRALAAGLSGDPGFERTCIDRALALCVHVRSGTMASYCRTGLSWHHLLGGRPDESERVLEQLPDPATIGPPMDVFIESDVMHHRAIGYAARGDVDSARSFAQAALGLARKTVSRQRVFAVLLTAACAARSAREIKEADGYIHEALAMLSRSKARVWAPDLFEIVAGLQADVAAERDAVRLFACAAALRSDMGVVCWNPLGRATEDIDGLRRRVDGDVFEQLWADGSGLSFEDALAYASRGRGPRKRPIVGWDSLTPTELQVVTLVAQGLSNREVAAKLLASPRTVSTHLTRVFAKLSVASRTELVALATRRGV